jgi:predicted small lipoprotein YifL
MSTAIRAAALLAAVLLAGCGKTGDLYLPDRGGEVVTRPTATPPPPTDDETGKKKRQDGATPPPQPQQ